MIAPKRYYQPERETMPVEKIREHQSRLLVEQVRHVWENVPYYRNLMDEKGVKPEDIHCVSIMPCVAKKAECAIPSINDSGCERDVDSVWSVREVARLIRRESIDVTQVPEEDLDSPLGEGTGAAVIFGATGGVCEAAMRTAYYLLTGQEPPTIEFTSLRGNDGVKTAQVTIDGTTIRACAVNGIANVRDIIADIRNGTCPYDFIEVILAPSDKFGSD